MEIDGDKYQHIGPKSQFGHQGKVVMIDGEGPSVAVFSVRDKIYAIDKFCYHHGGKLFRYIKSLQL